MLLEEFREIGRRGEWKLMLEAVAARADGNMDFKKKFHTYWTEAGHRIREQCSDDQLLALTLRKLLPRYVGPSTKLYRGENIDRWESKQVGFCWSSQLDTAKMFASGLNAVGAGGVLLETLIPHEAIIAGPSDHSLWLGEAEFTIDPFSLNEIQEIRRYPSSSLIGGG